MCRKTRCFPVLMSNWNVSEKIKHQKKEENCIHERENILFLREVKIRKIICIRMIHKSNHCHLALKPLSSITWTAEWLTVSVSKSQFSTKKAEQESIVFVRKNPNRGDTHSENPTFFFLKIRESELSTWQWWHMGSSTYKKKKKYMGSRKK